MRNIIKALVTTLIVLIVLTLIVGFIHNHTDIVLPGFIEAFATAVGDFLNSLKEFFNAHNPFVHIN